MLLPCQRLLSRFTRPDRINNHERSFYASYRSCRVVMASRRGSGASPGICILALALGSGKKRSEEHTSELQSLMRISYAGFCLKKKKHQKTHLEEHSQNTITQITNK